MVNVRQPVHAAADGGRLVLAATPIGDARDASPRLAEALATADIVAAEDTRRLHGLTAALGVKPSGRVVSHYDAVEAGRLSGLVEAVRGGATVLVVTDAGMPLVSDPGYRLAAACAAEGLTVTCLPGPSAVTAALAVSGLPADRFCFEGFAPRKPGERRRWLAGLASEPRTAVLFEAPHRIAAMLADAVAVFGGDRRAALCRELTKRHEEVLRGTLAELAGWVAERPPRGEITVVLAGAQPAGPEAMADVVPRVLARVTAGERLKEAVAAEATRAGVVKRELYDATLAARDQP